MLTNLKVETSDHIFYINQKKFEIIHKNGALARKHPIAIYCRDVQQNWCCFQLKTIGSDMTNTEKIIVTEFSLSRLAQKLQVK